MDDSEKKIAAAIASVGLGLIAIGVALLIMALKQENGLITGLTLAVFQWGIFIAQIFIGLVLGMLLLWLICYIVTESIKFFASEIKKFQTEYKEELEEVKKRSPTLIVFAALIAQVVVLFADKAFKGATIPTLAVSVSLLVIFWLSNELFIAGDKKKQVGGWIVWAVGVLTLPIGIMIFRDWSLSDLVFNVLKLCTTTLLFFLCAGVIIVILPFVFSQNSILNK